MEKPAETALTTLEDEQRLLERQKIRSERIQLRRASRIEKLATALMSVKITAARQVELKKYAFASEEELDAAKLSSKEKAWVRGWENPKRNAPYALESSSKIIEAETRAQVQKQGIQVNVEKLIIKLPTKGTSSDLPPPVYVDVPVESK